MDTSVTRAEYEEFGKRIDAHNKRQDKRIEMIEDNISQIITRQITTLTTMVEKTALSVENILKEQEAQEKRIEDLEGRDGEKWRQVTGYLLTTVAGAILGYILTSLGV